MTYYLDIPGLTVFVNLLPIMEAIVSFYFLGLNKPSLLKYIFLTYLVYIKFSILMY